MFKYANTKLALSCLSDICCSMNTCLMKYLMRHVQMKMSTSEQQGLSSALFSKGTNILIFYHIFATFKTNCTIIINVF